MAIIDDIKKTLYLVCIKLVSMIYSKHVDSKKIVFMSSFPQVDMSFVKDLANHGYDVTVMYYTNSLRDEESLINLGIRCFKVRDGIKFVVKYLPTVSKSSIIVVDNHFGFLAGFNKNCNTEIIQIWHACGSIKKFGLCATQNKSRSKMAIKRFKSVYKMIDTYAVSSEEMKKVFEDCNDAKGKNFLFNGYHVHDWILNEEKKVEALSDTKLLLYAPTYRDEGEENIFLDIEELSKKIPSDWNIAIKLHPQMKPRTYEHLDNVIQYEQSISITEMLPLADCLVTDYSSVIFDFALLNKDKHIYIYANDYDQYIKDVGINEWFTEFYNNYEIKSVDELIANLSKGEFFKQDYFSNTWNKYSLGVSQKKLVEYIKNKNL